MSDSCPHSAIAGFPSSVAVDDMLACQRMSANHDTRAFAASAEADSPRTSTPRACGNGHPTHVRYGVLILTFLVAFVMYMDRTCIGIAAPTLMREFELNKIQMGWATSAFNAAYTSLSGPRRIDGRPLRAAHDLGCSDCLVVCLHRRNRSCIWFHLLYHHPISLSASAKPLRSLPPPRAPSCLGCPPRTARSAKASSMRVHGLELPLHPLSSFSSSRTTGGDRHSLPSASLASYSQPSGSLTFGTLQNNILR